MKKSVKMRKPTPKKYKKDNRISKKIRRSRFWGWARRLSTPFLSVCGKMTNPMFARLSRVWMNMTSPS